MEQQVVESKVKAPAKNKNYSMVRIRKDTYKKVLQYLAKINRKDVGQIVRADAYFDHIVNKTTADDLKYLESNSLSHEDRLELDYRDYVQKHGQIKWDVYLGKRLSGEIPNPSKDMVGGALEASLSQNSPSN